MAGNIFNDIYEKHESIKKVIQFLLILFSYLFCTLRQRIHSFRIPLSVSGQRFMGFVYFMIPVVFGYFILDWNLRVSERKLNEYRKSLPEPSMETNLQNRAIIRTILDSDDKKR